MGLKLKGKTYERGFFLADVHMDWPLGHEELYLINLTREGFTALFPMQGERRFRLIGSPTPGTRAGGYLLEVSILPEHLR